MQTGSLDLCMLSGILSVEYAVRPVKERERDVNSMLLRE